MLNITNFFGGSNEPQQPMKPQGFIPKDIPFGDLPIWETDEDIQLNFGYDGKTVPYTKIQLASLDGEYCILIGKSFYDLREEYRKILLNKVYLEYTLLTGGVSVQPAINSENHLVLWSSKDREFRINSLLYAVYGKLLVDKALKAALSYKAIDKAAMKEYRSLKKSNTSLFNLGLSPEITL